MQVDILLVEDSKTDFIIANNFFSKNLPEVSLHHLVDGTRLMETIKSLPNLGAILLDLNLPGESGEVLCDQIREVYPKEKLPVFVFSGLPESLVVKEKASRGFTGIIDKDFKDIEKTIEVLRTHFKE